MARPVFPGGPVAVRHAATVLVLRNGVSGLEVLMLRRSATASFLPGAYVFPGGVLDEADVDPRIHQRVSGLTDERASALLGVARHGLAYWVAAVRECFEESGLLLASASPPGPASERGADHSQEELHESRATLLDGGHGFHDVLERHDAHIAAERIVPWSRWVTPIGGPRRFDTRFFVTALDEQGSDAHVRSLSADHREMSDLRWFRPAEAIADPDVVLITPTVSALRLLERSSDANHALASARDRAGF